MQSAPSSTGTPSERLPLSVVLAYGAPSFAGAAIAIPIYVHMPKFYSDVILVPLGYIALAIAAARALDAITDPLMGWISDRTRTPWGRRKPWIAVGVPLCAVSFWARLNPPERLSPDEAAAWFAACFVLYFLFRTVYEIPHYGLGAELSLDYHERSRLFGMRSLFLIPGTLVAVVLPGLLASLGMGGPRTVLSRVALIFAILLVCLYGVLLARVRERPGFAGRESNPLVPGVRRALRNRPFRALLSAYVFTAIPGAIPGTLMPYFIAYVLQPENPDAWLAAYLFAYFGAGFLFLPVWIRIARRFGKRIAWRGCFIVGISGAASLILLGPGREWLGLILIFYVGAHFGAPYFLHPAMEADVIDYDELHTGRRREAQYGSFRSIVTKLVVIPSAAIPLAVLAALGYVPNQEQSPEVYWAIKGTMAFGPVVFNLIALAFAWRYPITEAVHQLIREGIDRHARAEASIDPLTKEIVPPPRSGEVDDPTAWFLDYFSRGELQRVTVHGPQRALRDVLLMVGLSFGALLAAVTFLRSRFPDMETEPGVLASIGVVLTGAALTALLFHLARLRPALRLRRAPVPVVVVRAHLGESFVVRSKMCPREA
jgi:GPH family glycoside/pentoside/hexuronide:cation symporter